MKINIIGGGIIGLFSAYYLQKEGYEVHIFDKTDFTEGCSYGNAGMITPSHFIPLAAPGVVAQGIRWMFDPASPFYIKPRLDLELLQWLWKFYRSCNRRQAAAAMPVLLDFNLLGKKLYREFAEETGLDFKLEERGILMLYQTPKKEKEEKETAEAALRLGIETQIFDRKGVEGFETGTTVNALGGIYYPCDAHLYPNLLMRQLIGLLKKKGAYFHGKTSVTGFEFLGSRVTALIANGEKYGADAFVIAAGSWSAKLLAGLGLQLHLQDGKGYSITLKEPAGRPAYATILTEAKVAVTPMGDDLRLGGTLELGGLSPRINQPRVKAILDAIPRYYPNLKIEMPPTEKIWYGYRPCPPDGLPYIGRLKGFDNVVLATGHAMMGLSLGPATGRMVGDIFQEKQLNKSYLCLFDPNRFSFSPTR
ncbi:MAG: FAD-dependent oxidoreductase [Lewinellaceae bacterium]|nr:FAD-dependent oxidoreductase [Saprospiraceae bacterium]MCB9339474.1 FAD-dependent oxidoreductase [Lewinellaceae bacterium]